MLRLSRKLVLGVLLTFAATSAWAADLAILHNGFSIRFERRTAHGKVTRLYLGADNSAYVEVPSSDIDHFERELTLAPAPVSPAATPKSSAPAGSPAAVLARPAIASAANLNDVVSEVSSRYQLDPDLVNSVIRAESGFNSRAVSPKGAQGLMQLMPQTASKLGVSNAFDPRANVEGGTQYLRTLLEQYNFDLVKALAAYNAGPLRVSQYGGVPPYYETQAYVARILRDFNRKKLAQKKAALATKTQRKAPSTRHSTAASSPAQRAAN